MEWVTVFSSADPFEVGVTRGLLESAGIPVLAFESGLNSTYPGLSELGKISLKVPPDRVQLAFELMAAEPQIRLDE